MPLVEEANPVVGSPIVGAHCNCLLEGLFRRVQLSEVLVCISETAKGAIVSRLQLDPLAVFIGRLLVVAGASKNSAQTNVRSRKRAVPFSAPAAILLRRAHPLFVMRYFVFPPVRFAKPGVG